MHVCLATFKMNKSNCVLLFLLITHNLWSIHSANFQINSCRWVVLTFKTVQNNKHLAGFVFAAVISPKTQKINKWMQDLANWSSAFVCTRAVTLTPPPPQKKIAGYFPNNPQALSYLFPIFAKFRILLRHLFEFVKC